MLLKIPAVRWFYSKLHFSRDMRIATRLQRPTRDCLRQCVFGPSNFLHSAEGALQGADLDRFICATDVTQHVPEASLEFRLALESFINPSRPRRSSTAPQNRAVAMRDRPNTTDISGREGSQFPSLVRPNPSTARLKPVVRVTHDVEPVSGRQLKAEFMKRSFNRRSHAELGLCFRTTACTCTPKLPQVRERTREIIASRRRLTSAYCQFNGGMDLQSPVSKNCVNKPGYFLSVPDRVKLTDSFPVPLERTSKTEEPTELTWEEFHSQNPACSKDVFFRCQSWLQDKYMQIPELQPSLCYLRSLRILELESDCDEIL